MIIAHLADLHLGYRAYTRTTPAGTNQREADVAAAAAYAFEKVVELRPDLVVIAGDVFYSIRPSNAAIAEAFRGVSKLAADLAGAPLVILAGDRDTPRAGDQSSILELFREIPGVRVATREAERFHLDDLDLELLAVPHAAVASREWASLPSSGGAAHRVLAIHGQVARGLGEEPLPGPGAEGGAPLQASHLRPEEWSYVALGHHPVAAQVAGNAWYPGSLERTSGDPWAEPTEKGFLSYDLARAEVRFHPVPTREVVQLPPISAHAREAEEVIAAVRSMVSEEADRISGALIRLVINDLPRPLLREIERGVLRDLRGRALHLWVEARPPQPVAERTDALTLRGHSLEAQVEAYLAGPWEPTLEGVERGRLIELARRYLAEAGEGAEH